MAASGVIILLLARIALPLAFDEWLMPDDWHARYSEYASAPVTASPRRVAPIQLWSEWSPDVGEKFRVRRTERLAVAQGQAFVGERLIPREQIAEYLDAKVRAGEIDYVLISTRQGEKWGGIVSILDECRKAEVRLVLLDDHEMWSSDQPQGGISPR